MKQLALVLCIAGALALTGCGGDDSFDDDSDGNDQAGNGDVTNLQTFVVNNCNDAPAGDPANINGASFPESEVTDPAESVYTRNCLDEMG